MLYKELWRWLPVYSISTKMYSRFDIRTSFDATVARFQNLQASSPVCAETYPVSRDLQYVSSSPLHCSKTNVQRSHLADHIESTRSAAAAVDPFEQWIEQVNLLETVSSDWVSYLRMNFLRASADVGNFTTKQMLLDNFFD